MKLIACIGGAAALAAVSLPAQRTQQSQTEVWEFLIEKYDTNKDAEITAEEYDRGTGKFTTYDRTGDGVLTQADFTPGGRGGRRGGRGAGGRGGAAISLAQADQMIARDADKDESRIVTEAEWKAVVNALRTGDVNGAQLAPLAKQANGTVRRFRGQMLEQFVSTFDADKSGSVSATEVGMAFARLDKDKSEALEWSELGLEAILPKAGEVAPDFVVPYLEKPNESVQLSSFAGDKPVALIFGSYT